MQQIQELVPRRAQELLAEALADTRVVTLNGARQTGKSTLARLAAQASPGAVVRLLDDPATSRAAHDDPVEGLGRQTTTVQPTDTGPRRWPVRG